jgi:hypothetical protein
MTNIEWLESKLTLHNGVEFLYVVDGYEVMLTTQDGHVDGPSAQAETLDEAITKLRKKVGEA